MNETNRVDLRPIKYLQKNTSIRLFFDLSFILASKMKNFLLIYYVMIHTLKLYISLV